MTPLPLAQPSPSRRYWLLGLAGAAMLACGRKTLTGAPFDAGDMDYCLASCPSPRPSESFCEMVGTLRVSQADGQTRLVLEDVRPSESRRLLEEKWEPIPVATIQYGWP